MSEYNIDNYDEIEKENGGNDIEKALIDFESKEKNKKKNLMIINTIILAVLLVAGVIVLIIIDNNDDDDDDDEVNENKDEMPIIIEPIEKYSYCLIFIHGLNDNPEHFQKYFENIHFSKKNETKLIFLRAPKIDVTYKNLKGVTSWFDIYNIPIISASCYNFEDAKMSENKIKKIILDEVKLLNGNYNKIIIAGHSQGGCLALYLGYSEDFLLGGVISLNGALFEETIIGKKKDSLNTLLLHGEKDVQLPISYHNKTIERISNFSGIEKFYDSEEDHFIDGNEKFIFKIEEFLNRTLE